MLRGILISPEGETSKPSLRSKGEKHQRYIDESVAKLHKFSEVRVPGVKRTLPKMPVGLQLVESFAHCQYCRNIVRERPLYFLPFSFFSSVFASCSSFGIWLHIYLQRKRKVRENVNNAGRKHKVQGVREGWDFIRTREIRKETEVKFEIFFFFLRISKWSDRKNKKKQAIFLFYV